MSKQNNQLKVLLLDTEMIVTNKFTVFSANAEVDKPKLSALQKKADDEMTRLRSPQIWLRPLEVDSSKLFSCMVAIEKVDAPQLDELTAQIDTLIDLLETALTTAELHLPTETDVLRETPNSNLEAKEAILNIRRKRQGRFLFFANQGIDLATNTSFQTLFQRQEPLLNTYRDKLMDNTVAAGETNVLMLNSFAKAFQVATELPTFLRHMEELNDYVEKISVTA